MISHYLSFDLGASSGRAFVVTLEDGSIRLDEIHRFLNKTITDDQIIFWDFEEIIKNIKFGIKSAFERYPKIQAIGIDTWGVDYGLLDKNGKLLRNPVCYRDRRTQEILAAFHQIISKENLYKKTGIQFMPFNTIYQLYHDTQRFPQLIESANTLLLMPDLIAYYLTGEKRIELTNFSTTNLYDQAKLEIIQEIDLLGIPKRIFPKMINSGEAYGKMSKELAYELGIPEIPVVAVCSHDTASAILSIPENKPHIYISSGTWSLCGTLLDKPITNQVAMQENYTNEIGFNNIRFLKNIMGLWIVNCCRSFWEEEGLQFTNQEIEEMILMAKPFMSYIDPDDEVFIQSENMVQKIQSYCRVTGQAVPITPGEILRCVYQSLAFKYRFVIEKLEQIVNMSFEKIVIVGGGGQIDLLNQMTASLCDKLVEIGPQEATIIGNALMLMLYDKKIKTIKDGKLLVSKFIGNKSFQPLLSDEYMIYYQNYCDLIARGGQYVSNKR